MHALPDGGIRRIGGLVSSLPVARPVRRGGRFCVGGGRMGLLGTVLHPKRPSGGLVMLSTNADRTPGFHKGVLTTLTTSSGGRLMSRGARMNTLRSRECAVVCTSA